MSGVLLRHAESPARTHSTVSAASAASSTPQHLPRLSTSSAPFSLQAKTMSPASVFPPPRMVPPHSPAAVSALSDHVDVLSLSPHTPLPPQLVAKSQNTSAVISASAATARMSSETDERSSINNDSVIRNGWLMKRGKQRWTWNRRWFVLRPTQLSWYKDESEYKAVEIVQISDINTAAILSDKPDKRRAHFAIFTPSKNLHLQAASPKEAENWVADINSAVKVAEQADYYRRTSETHLRPPNFGLSAENLRSSESLHRSVLSVSTAAGATPPIIPIVPPDQAEISADELPSAQPRQIIAHSHIPHATTFPVSSSYHSQHSLHSRQMRHQSSITAIELNNGERAESLHSPSLYDDATFDLSNDDVGFSSGASEYGLRTAPPDIRAASPARDPRSSVAAGGASVSSTNLKSTTMNELARLEKEKVIQSGYLFRLVNRYNQWRKKWVVLRKGSLCFYKTEEEYKTLKVVPLNKIIDVMEVDPLAKNRKYCMQIILPEKRIRLCADTEDNLTRWLVAIKSAVSLLKKDQERSSSEHKNSPV
ncbi:uncharacterized protein V1518DRAFT_437350 [Limtongia smithiae]|uniref:uncharacterized protein n=1 Tax=Limtongia smithiae TaxID=1125753 RepID=UPI0034CE025F